MSRTVCTIRGTFLCAVVESKSDKVVPALAAAHKNLAVPISCIAVDTEPKVDVMIDPCAMDLDEAGSSIIAKPATVDVYTATNGIKTYAYRKGRRERGREGSARLSATPISIARDLDTR